MELITTKDGNKTVTINSVTIHSKYSPIKEASKFVLQSVKNKNGAIIVIGSGLGYILSQIEVRFPKLKIINIPLNKETANIAKKLNPAKCISWDMESNIEDFVNKAITNDTISNLQVIFWQPMANQYPDLFNKISSEITKRVRLINGNILTTARFGKLWIKNSIRNFICTNRYIINFEINKPIVITASGPSLENTLETLKEIRGLVTIFALSSSLLALKENGIKPDLVFSTDPGYYSKLHIYGNKAPLAMPLSNSTNSNAPVLLLNQGNLFENELINLLNLPNIRILENGTVAGTALDFALQISKGKIYLTGQDLQSNNIKSHISPYAFDNLLKSQENRLSGYHDIMYKRWLNCGVSFKTYRDWFIGKGSKNNSRIFRISPIGAKIENITDISTYKLKNEIEHTTKSNRFNYITIGSKKERLTLVINLLKEWLSGITSEKTRLKELIYLISPESSTDGISKTKKFLEDLLILYGRELLQ